MFVIQVKQGYEQFIRKVCFTNLIPEDIHTWGKDNHKKTHVAFLSSKDDIFQNLVSNI